MLDVPQVRPEILDPGLAGLLQRPLLLPPGQLRAQRRLLAAGRVRGGAHGPQLRGPRLLVSRRRADPLHLQLGPTSRPLHPQAARRALARRHTGPGGAKWPAAAAVPPGDSSEQRAARTPSELQRQQHVSHQHHLVQAIRRPGHSGARPQGCVRLHKPLAKPVQRHERRAPPQPRGQQEAGKVTKEGRGTPQPIARCQPRTLLALSLPQKG
mmetsp:Transcript_84375/g.251493  ORF Transcript_84375/g.251493 Transcript_84375/m.251493 type:complete len:211 (-) Transcript_84375:284-916(-)